MKITGKTKILGIIGNPIEHSLSPIIQNRAIALLNLDYIYVPFPVLGEDIKTALDGFRAVDIKGFNVTIPHKQAVMPFLSHITDTAKLIGAVNTLWQTLDGWHGTNTDIDGFIAPLKALNRNWADVTPIVLGNGGASRAVIVGCAQLGCKEIKVVGRNFDKLKEFQSSWDYELLQAKITIHPWDELSHILPQSDLIVNTTPLGMSPHTEKSPLDNEQISLLKQGAIVYDLIYTPRPTLLLQQAQKQGATIIDGTEMLVQQGAVGFEIWTGEKAPVDGMRDALLDFLPKN
ncbi:MAG: shikimate dehydrogenase [Cyanobacterium sp.]